MPADPRRDLAYRETPERTLTLDLYEPPDEGPHPAVVFVHGGAWRSGEKGQFDAQARRLADRGYAGLAVEYRLSGEATYPAAVRDVVAAVRWARADPEGVGLDGRVAAVGQSAGAHLAALAGLAGDRERYDPGERPGPDGRPDAVVGTSGIYDLATFRREGPYCEQFLGATYDEAADRYREASPLACVGANAPPTLLCYATDDDLVANDQSERFRDALAGRGATVETFVADAGGHRFFREEPWVARTTDRFEAFLGAHLD